MAHNGHHFLLDQFFHRFPGFFRGIAVILGNQFQGLSRHPAVRIDLLHGQDSPVPTLDPQV